jgi:hypothetical protein
MGYVDEDLRHLRWIRNRLIKVHGENPNTDYMIKFKAILDGLRDESPTARKGNTIMLYNIENVKYPIAGVSASPKDIRDIAYVSPFKPEELDEAHDLREHVYEVEDQGDIGSCVVNGLLGSLETIMKRNGDPEDYSRMALYNMTKAYSGRLGEEGLYTRNAYKVASTDGVCFEEDYPYDKALDNVRPPKDIYEEAAARLVDRYEFVKKPGQPLEVADIVHNIRSCLQEGLTVEIAFPVTPSIYDLAGPWQEHEYLPENKDNRAVGGHLVRVVGCSMTHKRLLCLNSWGEEYGDGGYFGLGFDALSHPFFEAMVVRSFNGYSVPLQPGVFKTSSSTFTCKAKVVPRAEELGEELQVWVGAEIGGTALIKLPVARDAWRPMNIGEPVPAAYTIGYAGEENYIDIVTWTNMDNFRGAKFYATWGRTLEQAIATNGLHLIHTL